GSDASAPFSVTWSGQPADGTYTLVARAVDRVGNATVSNERVVTVDNSGPAASLELAEGTRPDLLWLDAGSGTLFYNPAAAGDFTLTATASDPAGVQSVDFPSVSEPGFTGSALTDATSPYESGAYAFTSANAAAPADATVVVTDAVGNETTISLSFVRDVTAPAGGSVSYPDGYDADGQVTVSVDAGTDSLSGVDAATGVLERRTIALVGGVCNPFGGGWTPVSSPDTVPPNSCAQYRYRVSDRVGNEVVYASGNVVKVDLSAPQTTIGAAPGDPSSDDSPSFQFSASEPGSSFECELDGSGFAPCTSPESYAGLADGSHAFRVRATDAAGNVDPTPA
ncbi:MAG: hypothetical protein ACRDY6_02045, partial [Acidimicrobiia bacterium]